MTLTWPRPYYNHHHYPIIILITLIMILENGYHAIITIVLGITPISCKPIIQTITPSFHSILESIHHFLSSCSLRISWNGWINYDNLIFMNNLVRPSACLTARWALEIYISRDLIIIIIEFHNSFKSSYFLIYLILFIDFLFNPH